MSQNSKQLADLQKDAKDLPKVLKQMKDATSRATSLEEQIREMKNVVNDKERQLRDTEAKHKDLVKRLEKSTTDEKRGMEVQIKQLEEKYVNTENFFFYNFVINFPKLKSIPMAHSWLIKCSVF